jgi:hypothetical protein
LVFGIIPCPSSIHNQPSKIPNPPIRIFFDPHIETRPQGDIPLSPQSIHYSFFIVPENSAHNSMTAISFQPASLRDRILTMPVSSFLLKCKMRIWGGACPACPDVLRQGVRCESLPQLGADGVKPVVPPFVSTKRIFG